MAEPSATPGNFVSEWFLGAPGLEVEAQGVKRLAVKGGAAKKTADLNAFICIFDLDAEANNATSPLRIEHFIRVAPELLAHQAFSVVPGHILQSMQAGDSVVSRIRTRLALWWPAFKSNGQRAKPNRKRPG